MKGGREQTRRRKDLQEKAKSTIRIRRRFLRGIVEKTAAMSERRELKNNFRRHGGGKARSKPTSRLWLCDTGSAHDIVGRTGLPDRWIQEHVEVLEQPVRLETANREILADRTIGLEFEAIGEQEIRPFVLENAPDLISIGRRCLEMGYSFHWPSGSKSPFFVLPESDQRVHLQVVDYLPYLVDMHNVEGLSKNLSLIHI